MIRRIFRPEEKAEAVRLADECGNDRKIMLRLGLSQGAIGRWRSEGFGRVMQTTSGGIIEKSAHVRTSYPSLRCPGCSSAIPLQGEPTNANRVKGFDEHYVKSPECLAKNLRRVL